MKDRILLQAMLAVLAVVPFMVGTYLTASYGKHTAILLLSTVVAITGAWIFLSSRVRGQRLRVANTAANQATVRAQAVEPDTEIL